MKLKLKHEYKGPIDNADCQLCGFNVYAPWHEEGFNKYTGLMFGAEGSAQRRRLEKEALANMEAYYAKR